MDIVEPGTLITLICAGACVQQCFDHLEKAVARGEVECSGTVAVACSLPSAGAGCAAGRPNVFLGAARSPRRASLRLRAEEGKEGAGVDWDTSWQKFKASVREGVPEVEERSRVQTKAPR